MDKNHPNDTCLNFLELDLAFKFFNGATSWQSKMKLKNVKRY
jgi:hypothetical protein